MTSKAVGLIETIGLVAAIEAADAAVKAANVTLLGYENTKGGGMITVKLVGDVGAVKAAVSAGAAAALKIGQVKSCHVIPRPHGEIEALLKQIDRGPAAEKVEGEKPKAAKPKSTPAQKTPAAESPPDRVEEKPKPKSKRRSSPGKKAQPKPTEAPPPEEPPVEPPPPEEPPVEPEEPKPSE